MTTQFRILVTGAWLLCSLLCCADLCAAQESVPAEQSQSQPIPRPIGMPSWKQPEHEPLPLIDTLKQSSNILGRLADALHPSQSGVLLIGILALLTVGCATRSPSRTRGLSLLLLLIPAFLISQMEFFWTRQQHAIAWSQFRFLTLTLMAVQVVTMVWLVFFRRSPKHPGWAPALATSTLRLIAIVALTANLATIMRSQVADSSYYTNIGAQRLRETGSLPYGDPWLQGGAAAAYGPATYALILPFHLAFDPSPRNAAEERPATYDYNDGMPVRCTNIVLHLIAALSLLRLGKRYGNKDVAWGLLALYCTSPFVFGLGETREALCGITLISESAPVAFSLLALAFLDSIPLLAGIAMGVAAASGFYPVLFFIPSLIFLRSQKRALIQFALAFILFGAAITWWTWSATEVGADENVVHVFLDQTLGHQTRTNDPQGEVVGYGDSTFGFWGAHPDLASFWLRKDLAGLKGLTPAMIVLAFVYLCSLLRSFSRDPRNLALAMAAIALTIQLPRVHASGIHVIWYLPFVFFALLSSGPPETTEDLSSEEPEIGAPDDA